MKTALFPNKKMQGWISELLLNIDWKLLLFLCLFLNVKLYIKVIAIVLIYISRFNVSFGFRPRHSRLPLFYIAIILIALLNLVLHALYRDARYDLVFVNGIFFWLLCILAIHQLKLAVDTLEPRIVQNTLVAFFAINAAVSFGNILAIMLETGQYNPYLYQGSFQKYFIGTGDYIKGIFSDTSTTNAIINAFGVVYFLNRKQVIMALVCMIVVLLTGSNLTNLLLAMVLIGIFFFQSNRNQKSVMSVCLFLIILFLARVSPQNNGYTYETFKNTFSLAGRAGKTDKQPDLLSVTEAKKQAIARAYLDSLKMALTPSPDLLTGAAMPQHADSWIRPSIPKPDINGITYQSSADTTALQRQLIAFAQKQQYGQPVLLAGNKSTNIPGKFIALEQTFYFLRHNPALWLTGSGMGTFSSKLAFRATALNIAGGYPAKYAYVNPAFGRNHLALFIYYFTKRTGFHSVINTPDSVVDQLFSEYGIVGFLSFLFFYAGFFIRHLKQLSFGIPLMFIMAGVFMLGYWFEQLSVVVLFELLLLIDMKSGLENSSPKTENR